MDGKGYTWFGAVLYRVLRSRGSSQSALAREAQERGLDYRQNSISNWMRGVHAAPRDLPTLLDDLYGLSEEERVEVALSFAYGQRTSRRDFEDTRRFRSYYRRLLEEEKETSGRSLGRSPTGEDREE